MPLRLSRDRGDDCPGSREIILVDHHPHRDEELAAVGDTGIAVKGDRRDIFRFQATDQDMGFVAIETTELNQRHSIGRIEQDGLDADGQSIDALVAFRDHREPLLVALADLALLVEIPSGGGNVIGQLRFAAAAVGLVLL